MLTRTQTVHDIVDYFVKIKGSLFENNLVLKSLIINVEASFRKLGCIRLLLLPCI